MRQSSAAENAPHIVQLRTGAPVWVAVSAEPLLLLHGWGLGPPVYVPGLQHLAEHDFHVAAPTIAVVGKQWTIDRAVHRAVKALDALEWDKATVVGNSLGGAVAISLAAHHPDRVRALG